MTTTTAITNQKGGVCKSSTTVNLAYSLAERGEKVLAVDCDPQGHSSLYCGMRETRPKYGSKSYQLLTLEDVTAEECIRSSPYKFDIISGGVDVTAAEVQLQALDKLEVLRDKLDALGARYDHILIDCPPSVAGLTQAALMACDCVLIPVTPDGGAVDGIGLLLDTMEHAARWTHRGRIDLLGLLLSRVENPLTRVTRSVIMTLEQMPGALFTQRIREASPHRAVPDMKKPVMETDPKHPVCGDIRAAAEEYLVRVQRLRGLKVVA